MKKLKNTTQNSAPLIVKAAALGRLLACLRFVDVPLFCQALPGVFSLFF